MKFRIPLLIIIWLAFPACTAFNSDKWKNDKSSRKKQVKAIIKSKVLVNKTYPQVLELLGPEDLNFNRDDTIKSNFRIEYIVGNVFIDFDRLAIRFQKDIVDSVYRYHD